MAIAIYVGLCLIAFTINPEPNYPHSVIGLVFAGFLMAILDTAIEWIAK